MEQMYDGRQCGRHRIFRSSRFRPARPLIRDVCSRKTTLRSMELFSSIAHREFEPLSNKNNGLLASAVNVIISRVQMQRPTNVCRNFHEDYLISE